MALDRIDVANLQEMDANELQKIQAQIINRMSEIVDRRRELAPIVQEDEGLKAELAALKSIKDGVKSMMENLPK